MDVKHSVKTCDVDDLTSDLTQVHTALHPDKPSGGDSEEGEVELAAHGEQPKKRCHNHSKLSILACNCNEGGNNKRGGNGTRNPFWNRGNNSSGGGGNPHRNLECSHCKKKGHIKKKCFKLQAMKKREGKDISDHGEIALMAFAAGLPHRTIFDIPTQDVAVDGEILPPGPSKEPNAVSIEEGSCSSACTKEICNLHDLEFESVCFEVQLARKLKKEET